jgi:integrase
VLRVEGGKTEMSDRPRQVPEVLQHALRKLAAGREPFEPLFKSSYTGSGFYTRRWLEQALEKFCREVGIPRVVPHALKGTAGSILAATGELSDRIADHLSHEQASTTTKHYVAPGAVETAQAARGLKVIAGGRR